MGWSSLNLLTFKPEDQGDHGSGAGRPESGLLRDPCIFLHDCQQASGKGKPILLST